MNALSSNKKVKGRFETKFGFLLFVAILAKFSLSGAGLSSSLAEPKRAQRPFSPEEYQKLIGQGFATNWFKSKDPLSKYHAQNIIDIAL